MCGCAARDMLSSARVIDVRDVSAVSTSLESETFILKGEARVEL